MSEIVTAFSDTIEKSNLSALAVDYSEIGLDSLIHNDVLKEIPIISTIISIGKMGVAIHDHLFLQKILAFFNEIKSIPPEERYEEMKKIEQQASYQKKVGQALVLIIDKLDAIEKAKLIGRLFYAKLKGEITYEEFLRLSRGVDRVFLPDLRYLDDIKKDGNSVDHEIQSGLSDGGFLVPTPPGAFGGAFPFYITRIGELYLTLQKKYMF